MNYTSLGTAVTGYGHRPDLAALLDTFIELAEQDIYFGVEGATKPLRIEAMDASTSAGLPTLPADFLEARHLSSTASGRRWRLDYVSSGALEDLPASQGTATCFTVRGSTVVFDGTAPTAYTLRYYKRLATPSGTNATNWILTNAPGVYLHAVRVQVAKFARDTEEEAKALRDFAAAVGALQKADNASKWNAGMSVQFDRRIA